MRLAFCTLWGVLALVAASSTPATAAVQANLAGYQWTQLQWGATSLPLAAQIEYRAAVECAGRGERIEAEQHLDNAIKLAPDWPDAYFTMSRLKFRRFDPDALYFLVRGVNTIAHNFEAQSLLAVNIVIVVMIGFVFTLSIVLLAFALRYLPFVAHRPSETLSRRFRAAFPRTTAYFVISLPFALFPGFVTGACALLLMTWHFMHRREKLGTVLLIIPFIVAGWFSSYLKVFSPIVDPASFTMMAAESIHSPGDTSVINGLARNETPELQADKHNALGQIYLRREELDTAAEHFLKAIALRPGEPDAYINLGNVYYAEGMWEKALEGYRKAVNVDSLDAVGQYNLAQAYIKTLLMAESSKALRMANEAGINGVREKFAVAALDNMEVYPKTLGVVDLWRIAMIEGRQSPQNAVARALSPLLGFSPRVSAWMLFLSLVLSMALSRALKSRHLAFQCSNCGELMCEACGDAEHGSFICTGCHGVIKEVTSEKVVDALLRSRRQKIVVRRRKLIRSSTWWLPGLRDLFYGKLPRGVALSFLFSVSIVMLWSRGYLISGWNSLPTPVPLWHWVVPAIGIVFSFVASLASKRHLELRNYHSPETRQRHNESDDTELAQNA